MLCRKQFVDKAVGVCRLTSDVDAFVPEMSLPIKDILQQFAFIDNVRLADMAKRGYDFADNNDDDFDVEEFDCLDLAERDALYERAKGVIDKYNAYQEKLKRAAADLENDPPNDEDASA